MSWPWCRPVWRARRAGGADLAAHTQRSGRAHANALRLRRMSLLLGVALMLAACNAKLPEPESPGAKLYARRCGTCHRLYAPSSLTFAMWKVQVDRKQGMMVRQGLPPLTPAERDLLLDYLRRHSQ
jgi:hypothetical protein